MPGLFKRCCKSPDGLSPCGSFIGNRNPALKDWPNLGIKKQQYRGCQRLQQGVFESSQRAKRYTKEIEGQVFCRIFFEPHRTAWERIEPPQTFLNKINGLGVP